MGKGVVTANHGGGLYTATVIYDRTYADTRIVALNGEIDQYTTDIAAQEIVQAEQQVEVDAALTVRDAAADAYSAAPTDENYNTLISAQAEFAKLATQLNATKSSIALLEIRKSGAEKEIVYINNNIPDDYDVVSWCADFTDDIPISTEVGLISIGRVDHVGDGAQIVSESQHPEELTTALLEQSEELQVLRDAKEVELADFIIEHEGEILGITEINELNAIINAIQVLHVRQNSVNQEYLAVLAETGYDFGGIPELSTWYIIYPGKGSESYAYDPARDGNLTPIVSMSGASAYFNAALLPGAVKWKPTYRIGTVTAVNKTADTADITLDYLASTWQGLNVNQTPTLSSVPIEYGICNSAVFDVDDRVLVGFDSYDWSQPKVLGFESEPRRCNPRYYVFHGGTHYTVWDIIADTIASIIDPITTAPIPMPATAAEMANWLADNTVAPTEGQLYDKQDTDGIDLGLPVVVIGPPVEADCNPPFPPTVYNNSTATSEGTSRGGLYSGTLVETSVLVAPCAAFPFLDTSTYDVEDFDFRGTVGQFTPDSLFYAKVYTASVGPSSGQEFQFRNTNTGSRVTSGGVNDGSYDLAIQTPLGPLPPVPWIEWDGLSASSGAVRNITFDKGLSDTRYSQGVAVQVYAENVSYNVFSHGPVLPPIERIVAGAISLYANIESYDPLAQDANVAFTASLQACLDASAGITPLTGSFYR